MSLVCGQCSRVNPAEAAYCYHDGAALAGRAGGPINAGSAAFPSQFVFPNGLACRNFDQLAMACQQHWSSALDLLKQGYLGSFFGGMGRIDLAMAAQEAARFPDLDRGLDQLIAKLPTQAIQAPKLQAEPSDINLGLMKVGEERTTELHLTNLGMRLLYGTVTSDCKWLTLGDAPGHAEKMFQFGSDAIVPVRVRGQHLRAGTKPLEGHLTIDTNGGLATVTLRADVPITPYEGGMFAGAVTPRQVAEKAKANAKDAAVYFENGGVAKWYAANGWAYPVQAPIMPGTGAIQQFFEALGVAKPPKVEFSPKKLELQGAVGKTIEASIEVATAERKLVYGWALCNQTWITFGKTKLAGKSATIPITVRIPKPCPRTLEATIHVMGNGTQKIDVPIKVTVAGGKAGVKLDTEIFEAVELVEEPVPMTVEILDAPVAVVAPPKTPPSAAPTPLPTAVSTAPMPAMTLPPAPPPAAVAASTAISSAPMALVETPAAEDSPFALTDAPASSRTSASVVTIPKPPERLPLPLRLGLHFIPVAILGIFVLVLLVHDIFFAKPAAGGGDVNVDVGDVDPRPHVMVKFDEGRLDKHYEDTMNFAVHKLDPTNKNTPPIKLNWYDNGSGNSIVAMIDNKELIFGIDGKWAKGSETGQAAGKWGGKTRSYDFSKEGIRITQTVTIEPGDLVHVGPGADDYKRLLTMCLARYKIQNVDKKTHSVGLRILMDTCIGDKDDVPFLLPGVDELVTTYKDFKGAEVPDFVQVIERPGLRDQGIVLQLNLRFAETDKFEAPSRFLLTRYPGKEDKRYNKWKVDVKNFEDDSCVVMYWDPRDLEAGKTREVGFTYGLGDVSAQGNLLGLTVGGTSVVNGELTVVALVADKTAKTIKLQLPKGLELVKGELEQTVKEMRPDRNDQLRPSPVTWRVRANEVGKHTITVTTNNGLTQSRRVTITTKSLFN